MPRRTIELVVGLGLLLGPLGYALTLESEVVEVPTVVQVDRLVTLPGEVRLPEREVEPEPTEPELEPEPEAAEPTPPEPATPDLHGRLAFAFVNEAGLILSTEAIRAWSTGRVRAHPGPGLYRAAKRANGKTIPDELWAHRGRTFDLYGADGKVCTARVGAMSVLAQHNGPSLYEMYYGADYDDETEYDEFEAAHPSAKEIRRKVWSSASDDTLWLAAKLISDEDCQGALWARDEALPLPTVLRRTTDVSEPGGRRLAEHHASDALAEVKAHYIEWYRELGEFRAQYDPWDTLVKRHPATVASWLEADIVRLVELEFGEEPEGCGDGDDTRITSLDLVVGTAFEPLDRGSNPKAVFDSDLDGKFELLYSDELSGAPWYLGSETVETSWSLDEVFVCPC